MSLIQQILLQVVSLNQQILLQFNPADATSVEGFRTVVELSVVKAGSISRSLQLQGACDVREPRLMSQVERVHGVVSA